MPARGISSFADSDIEDASQLHNENTALTIESVEDVEEPPKKRGGRTKSTKNRVTKPKTAVTKKDTESTTKRAKKVSAPKRKALEEQVNEKTRDAAGLKAGKGASAAAGQDDTIMSDPAASEDELESPRTLAQEKQATANTKSRGKATASKNTKAKTGAQKHLAHDDTSRVGDKQHYQNNSDQLKGQHLEDATMTVSETQQEIVRAGSHPPSATRNFKSSIGASSRLERPARNDSTYRYRAGSASDTERNGVDPQLRRKLGDVTRKFESIELKYRNLRETGVVEANANVERLRKQCEATTAASNELVASLKKELAMQTTMASEYRKIQSILQSRDSENSQLLSKVSDLTATLTASQNEVKTLQAKLAASRVAASTVESTNAKPPGSAMKPSVPTRTVMVGSAEAAQAAQNAQLKEDLYSDLTGLIVRGVKRTNEEDMFDCIQTGRNGTLHFKLGVAHDNNGQPTSFEDTEFLYTPLLDSNRDRDLLELLPDYLTEDITFSRQHAAKFYSRVVETLTRKRSDE